MKLLFAHAYTDHRTDPDRLLQELGVVHVGASDRHCQRSAVLLDEDTLLRAHLRPVSRVWAALAALEAALSHHSVDGLPFPVDVAEFLALPG
jgi:hypothetical protein